jgi:geranylgeranyl diphosphate synthase type I
MVEEAVEKHVPRRLTHSYLVTHFGEARFKHSPESLTEGLSKPFWELFSRGGKRWRPALTILIYEALGGRAEDVAFAAAVPEIIHNATLIVDDVEDSSQLRRGQTMHTSHLRRGYSGECGKRSILPASLPFDAEC